MKQKKTIIIMASLFIVVCIAFSILLTMVIIPSQKLNKAKKLIDSGDYEAAYSILSNLNYKDSEDLRNSIKLQYEKALLSKASVGSYVIWGTYEQDNNLENGAEEIEWLVLAKEENRILVISRYALDCQKYNTSKEDVTWETCSLRQWLNGSFLDTAFSEAERAMIPIVTVSADKNPRYDTNPGNSTSDQVFLLSITEAIASKYFSGDSARVCQGTAYCYAQGAYKYETGKCWWWLRSPGNTSSRASSIDAHGSVHDIDYAIINDDFAYLDLLSDNVDGSNYAVRPAMWIDLNALSQKDT